jgi:excisionase family DNA binding protein
MGDSPDVFLSPGEIAARLRVTVPTVQSWLRNGKLQGLRISGRWRVSERELKKYLEGQSPAGTVVVKSGRLNYGVAPNGEILWFEVK